MFQTVSEAANNLTTTQAVLVAAVGYVIQWAALRWPQLAFLKFLIPKPPNSPVDPAPAPAPAPSPLPSPDGGLKLTDLVKLILDLIAKRKAAEADERAALEAVSQALAVK